MKKLRIHANLPVNYSNLAHPLWFDLYACPPPPRLWPHLHVPALLVISLPLQHRLLLLLLQLALLQLPGPVTGFDLHGKLWVHFLLQGDRTRVMNMFLFYSVSSQHQDDYPTVFFFPFQVSIMDLNLRLALDGWDGTTPLRTRFYTNSFENDPHLISYLSALSLAPPDVHFVNDGPL